MASVPPESVGSFTRAPRAPLLNFTNHVVIAFESRTQARGACHALAEIGYAADEVRQWTEAEILDGLKTAIDIDRRSAGLPCHPQAAQKTLFEPCEPATDPGHHWLIVRVNNEGRGQQVVDCVRRFGPQRARHYRHAGFVELMENRFPALAWPTRDRVEAS